jgi:hypothetical protein
MQYLNNISIPNQTLFDSEVDTDLSKIQVVQDRLYAGSKKIQYKDEFLATEETNPVYTYVNGSLSRVDYESGNYKVFTYGNNSNLIQVDFHRGFAIYRKILQYDSESNLVSIAFSVI